MFFFNKPAEVGHFIGKTKRKTFLPEFQRAHGCAEKEEHFKENKNDFSNKYSPNLSRF
jgi:hypothetical protein